MYSCKINFFFYRNFYISLQERVTQHVGTWVSQQHWTSSSLQHGLLTVILLQQKMNMIRPWQHTSKLHNSWRG